MDDNYFYFKIGVFLSIILFITLFLLPFIFGQKIPQKPIIKAYIEKVNKDATKYSGTIAASVLKYSEAFGFCWPLIVAIMQTESHFDKNAVGLNGEIGLMQIYTLKCSGNPIDKDKLTEIDYNIYCGCCILYDKWRISNHDICKTIKLYNGKGPATEIYLKKILTTQLNIINFTEGLKTL